jgi:23S rRNA pseudouridine1911/1915/1917 synthase
MERLSSIMEATTGDIINVTATGTGRLDRMLASLVPDMSRARLQALIADGRVSVNARTILEAKHRVKQADAIEVRIPPPVAAEPQPEAIPLDIVFEDDHVLVIDKPAGMVVHPAAGNQTGTLVNAIIAHCGDSLSGIGGVKRPGIVHRLDKDTSGLLVIAKTDKAHHALSAQFASHGRDGKLERTYRALVWGHLPRRRGTIDAAIARHPSNRQKMAVSTRPEAKKAITHYEVIAPQAIAAEDHPVSLIECRLETGRTHQIRVHLAHIGHPLLGDRLYGAGFRASEGKLTPQAQAALAELGRQALHACQLGFEHPESKEKMSFESALPKPFQALLHALEL